MRATGKSLIQISNCLVGAFCLLGEAGIDQRGRGAIIDGFGFKCNPRKI